MFALKKFLYNEELLYVCMYHAWSSHIIRRYFQHAHSVPIVGVGKRGAYQLVHGDPPRQHSFGTTLRFTGPMPAVNVIGTQFA